jgi:hypothetical protein
MGSTTSRFQLWGGVLVSTASHRRSSARTASHCWCIDFQFLHAVVVCVWLRLIWVFSAICQGRNRRMEAKTKWLGAHCTLLAGAIVDLIVHDCLFWYFQLPKTPLCTSLLVNNTWISGILVECLSSEQEETAKELTTNANPDPARFDASLAFFSRSLEAKRC